jgi:hypothetical protein
LSTSFSSVQLHVPLRAESSFGRGKARDRIGALLLSLVAADSVTTGGLADAPTNTESLMFDSKKFAIETVTVKDRKVAYRAYEGIVYVTNPVDARYQSLNFYVPVEYYEGKSVGGYTAEAAAIFLPNSVGGYAVPGCLRRRRRAIPRSSSGCPVEFGTSFGISTIFLASAIRDNGVGRLIITEFEPAKADRARENLAAAEEWVELRIGDVRGTLSDSPRDIDLIFLDGAKELYFDVLKLLEPHLRAGGIVASDNTDHDGLEPFLSHVRHPSNGYISSAIFTSGPRGKAHEISIRC